MKNVRCAGGHIAVATVLAALAGTAVADWTDVATPSMANGTNRGAAWGDFDNDGDLDLYVTRWAQENQLFRNDGEGVFVDITSSPLEGPEPSYSGRAVWGDYDNDGDLDLYLAQSLNSHLFRNNGTAGFEDVTTAPLAMSGRLARTAAWADYDNDGLIDVYVGSFVGVNNASRLIHNDGNGLFTDVTDAVVGDPGIGRGVAWADYDNDCDQDLYLTNGSSPDGDLDPALRINRLFRNDQEAFFTDVTTGPLLAESHSRGVAWGDYDNDGDFDLYIAAISVFGKSGQNQLLRNDGNDVFTDVTTGDLGFNGLSRCCSWVDYDNDGDLDLYLVNAFQPCMLLENDGGEFSDATTGLLAGIFGDANTAAWADYDQDGDMDAYVAYGTTGQSFLARNDIENANHWLQVRLIGTLSNRSAIGARVTVIAGGQTQIREVNSGSGYFAQHQLDPHFGLGSAETVDVVKIQWPAGSVLLLQDVAVDQRLTVVEDCELGVTCSDCNGNGQADVADLVLGSSSDCNANATPDDCDIDDGTSADLDVNGVPDECEDCNRNGMPDGLDLSDGTSQDCDENGLPDECDIASGDLNDCNANVIPDDCEVAADPDLDENQNGILDVCEAIPGDINLDGVIDVLDLVAVIVHWGPCPEAGQCIGDANGDLEVNVNDLITVVVNWSRA